MLTVKETDRGLSIKCAFAYKDRVKKIPGAYFNYDNKTWIIPKSSLKHLLALFPGEIYFRTPLWKILGQPEPPKQDIRFFGDKIQTPKLNLTPYEYQKTGIQFSVDRLEKFGFCLIGDYMGLGKCHGKGTKILMHDGSVKNVEDVAVGDQVMGDDGTPRNVLSLGRGRAPMYRITLSNGDSFTCNEEHILSCRQENGIVNISVKDYLRYGCDLKAYKKGVFTFPETEIHTNPYIYGTQLGDKDIPNEYLINSEHIRLQLLAGILDSDGHITDNCFELCTKGIRNDILYLMRSLGFSVTQKEFGSICISGDINRIPVRNFRIKSQPKKLDYHFTVESLGEGDYYGFMIDGNHLYLLGDFTVTHNTFQATGAMKWYKDNKHINNILIICKKSLKYQWASELERYTGWTRIFITGETPKKRQEAYEAAKEGGILITNYHNFLNDTSEIRQIPFDLCVIDEAHSIKGKDGKMNKNITSVTQDKKTILMTGTPIMSKPDDIFGIVQLATKDYFGSYSDFESRYLVIENGIYGRQTIGAKNLDDLQNRINAFMIRRTTDDILEDLPKVLPPVRILAEMDATQKKIYEYIELQKEALNAKKEQLKGLENGRELIEELNEKSKMYIAASQFVADDPMTLKLGSQSRMKSTLAKMVPASYKMSNKTEATLDLVQEMREADEKVIIFCQYTTSAFMLKDLIEKMLKEEVVMYTGKENEEQRKEAKRKFYADTNVLIATEAAEAGLNLQIARYIINYEQPETYAAKEQRIGRIRRIDSKFSEIGIYDIITKGSFDEIRDNKINRDKDLSNALLS